MLDSGKCVGLSLLDSGEESWIKLVGLRRKVLNKACWTQEKCWIKLLELRRRVLDCWTQEKSVGLSLLDSGEMID